MGSYRPAVEYGRRARGGADGGEPTWCGSEREMRGWPVDGGALQPPGRIREAGARSGDGDGDGGEPTRCGSERG